MQKILEDPVLFQKFIDNPVSIDTIIDVTERMDNESYVKYQIRIRAFACLLRYQMDSRIIVNQGIHLKFMEEYFPEFDHTGQYGT